MRSCGGACRTVVTTLLGRCTIAAVAAIAAASPAGAAAASSTGLYEPFPSLNGGPPVQRYVGALGVTLKPARLARGVTVSADGAVRTAPAAGPGVASLRAGSGVAGGDSGVLGGTLVALVLAVAIVLAVAGRPASCARISGSEH